MKKMLVTGGAGFIGSNIVRKFAGQDYQIIIIDDLSMGKRENIPNHENINFFQGDVTNYKLMEEVFMNNQFDYIFHMAAIASVPDSIIRPVQTHKVNFSSVFQILELSKKFQPKLEKIIFPSSAAIYGDDPILPKSENSPIKLLTPYAIDKYSAEQYCLAYCRLYGVPATVVRFFNVFGENQNPNSPYSGVISILMEELIEKKNGRKGQFTIFGDGEQSRDYIYIQDVLRALELLINNSDTSGEAYNIGTGIPTKLNNLIHIMEKEVGSTLQINRKSVRDGDIKNSFANISKIKSLGFIPNYSVVSGIKHYYSSLYSE